MTEKELTSPQIQAWSPRQFHVNGTTTNTANTQHYLVQQQECLICTCDSLLEPHTLLTYKTSRILHLLTFFTDNWTVKLLKKFVIVTPVVH